MDKKTLIGFAVIFVILLLWMPLWNLFFPPPPAPLQSDKDSVVTAGETTSVADTIARETAPISMGAVDSAEVVVALAEPEKLVTIETEFLKVVLSSYGGTIREITLKKYPRYDTLPVTLIEVANKPQWASFGAMTLGYADKIPAFNSQNFAVEGGDMTLTPTDSTASVVFTHQIESGAKIVKTFVFHHADYLFDVKIDIYRPQDLGMKDGVTIGWFAPLEPTETDFNQDKEKLGGFFSMGGEVDQYRGGMKNGIMKKEATGPVDWIASRTKYFATVMMAQKPGNEVVVVGSQTKRTDPKSASVDWEQYGIGMTYPVEDNMSLTFNVYAGPLDYEKLRELGHGLSGLVDMGWKLFRPFAIAILWVLTMIHKAIPNYGLVIIVFSIVMKLVFWPLSQKSAKSMYKMKEIQPKLQEIREKFKNDPSKMNAETMKAYKEFGVNPFGSCLPMLIQMPVFFALYSVLGNTIALRGAEFVFWIKDLSQADPSGKFLFGIGILPIIMGIAMFFQQKLTITDPKQKMMVYLMPVLFTFLFSRWASGLVLYWTVFSVMGIIEQWYMMRNLQAESKTA